MMRSGRLLTEDTPQNLLAIHEMSSLEDVFLKLCMKSDLSCDGNAPITIPSISMIDSTLQRQLKKPAASKRSSRVFKPSLPSPYRIMTLTHKNFVQTFRNIGLVLA